MINFIDVLKYLRIKSGKSQKQLAKELDISERNYQRYEYGERVPSMTTFIKIAHYYNVSLDFLAGYVDKDVELLILSEKENNWSS